MLSDEPCDPGSSLGRILGAATPIPSEILLVLVFTLFGVKFGGENSPVSNVSELKKIKIIKK